MFATIVLFPFPLEIFSNVVCRSSSLVSLTFSVNSVVISIGRHDAFIFEWIQDIFCFTFSRLQNHLGNGVFGCVWNAFD